MENEKSTVPNEELVEKRDTPFIDGTIDDISELSAQAEEGEEVNPLDSLLYENEESDVTDADEEPDSFESFFAEYRQLIAENLDAARKMNTEEQGDESGASDSVEKVESLSAKATESAPAKAKKEKKKQTEESSEWSGEITLEPEEYESLDEEAEIFNVEPEKEEEIDLIGAAELVPEAPSEDSEDNIQLSFFAEEKTAESKNDEEPEERKYDPENPRKIDTVFDFLELFIFTLVAVMVLTTFVFKHSVVEGDSMNNTLEDGDHLIVWDAFYTPDRYDIIVFEDYSTVLKKAVVKRVIGLPGETVEVKAGEDGVFLVYVNGELIEEDYAYHGNRYSSPNTGLWELGEDEIFVMGDNRYNSADSRDENVGPIKIDSVLGKVVLRFYPFSKFGTFN